jgi:hypothetical protein
VRFDGLDAMVNQNTQEEVQDRANLTLLSSPPLLLSAAMSADVTQHVSL